MANPTQASSNAATAARISETITVRRNGSTTLEDLAALKSSLESNLERSTVTLTRALALGYQVDLNDPNATVVLQWRSPNLMKIQMDTFKIVKEATRRGDQVFDIVLSSEVTDRLLLAIGGGLIALARSRMQEAAEREKAKKEDEEAERRRKRELEEEERRRLERIRQAMASKQAAVATAS